MNHGAPRSRRDMIWTLFSYLNQEQGADIIEGLCQKLIFCTNKVRSEIVFIQNIRLTLWL